MFLLVSGDDPISRRIGHPCSSIVTDRALRDWDAIVPLGIVDPP